MEEPCRNSFARLRPLFPRRVCPFRGRLVSSRTVQPSASGRIRSIPLFPMTLQDRALFTAEFTLTEKTDPATPPLGSYTVFPQVDGNLYMKDSFGRVYPVGSPPGSLAEVRTNGSTLTHQIAVWENNSTVKGEPGFTYNSSTKEFSLPIDGKLVLGNNTILSRTNNSTRLSNINSLDSNTTFAIKTALNLQFTDVGGTLSTDRLSGYSAGSTTEFLRRDGTWRVVSVPNIPIGIMLPYIGFASEPEGWLWCDGRAVNGTTYLELYRVLVGNPNASAPAAFNLPDMRNRFPLGAGSLYGLGSVGGEANVTLNVDQIPPHSHPTSPHSHGVSDPGHSHTWVGSDGTASPSRTDFSPDEFGKKNQTETTSTSGTNISINSEGVSVGNTGGGQAHNNMPPYLALNFIIKAV